MARGKGTLNKVMLIGRLGQDPELRYTPGGAPVANFSLATNSVWKAKDGQTHERTEWHNIIAWNRTAEIANEYLKKGSRIWLEGELRTRTWDDRNGAKHYTTEVYVDKIEFLESKDSGSDSGYKQSAPPPPSSYSDSDFPEDDLPF